MLSWTWRVRLIKLYLILSSLSIVEDENHHHVGVENSQNEDFINREDYATIVDTILSDDDKDKDGYISWAEFRTRQKQQG